MGHVTESIFSGTTVTVAMKLVQHIEHEMKSGEKTGYITVITSGTTWNTEGDHWNNAIHLKGKEAKSFVAEWCRYRGELESEDHVCPEIIAGTREALDNLSI